MTEVHGAERETLPAENPLTLLNRRQQREKNKTMSEYFEHMLDRNKVPQIVGLKRQNKVPH